MLGREIELSLSPNKVAAYSEQLLHTFVSLFVVFGTAYLFPGNVTALFLAVGGLMGFVFLKEYVVDPRMEQGQDIHTGTVDAAFYLVGLVLAIVLLGAAHLFGRPF